MPRLAAATKKEYQRSSRVTNDDRQKQKAGLVARLFFAIVLVRFRFSRYALQPGIRFQTRPCNVTPGLDRGS
jgi:hypothetical protein